MLLLECGLAEDELPQALTALRRCVIARADSIRPQPLAVMVATLAVMQVGLLRDSDMQRVIRYALRYFSKLAILLQAYGMSLCVSPRQVRDVVWLSALAMACRNKMINMSPDQVGMRGAACS